MTEETQMIVIRGTGKERNEGRREKDADEGRRERARCFWSRNTQCLKKGRSRGGEERK